MNDKINEILAKFAKEHAIALGTNKAGQTTEAQVYANNAQTKATTQINQAVLAEALACVGQDVPIEMKDAYADPEHWVKGMTINSVKSEIRKKLNTTFGGER